MKTIAQILAVMVLVVFTWGYFNNKSKLKLKDKLELCDTSNKQFKDMISILQNDYAELQEAKLKTDTIIVTIKGEKETIYDTMYPEDLYKVKTLNDSVVTDELRVNYIAEYIGKIYNSGFSYEVNAKTITNDNIVYVDRPYPVEKLVPINTHSLYLGGGLSTYNGVNPYLGIIYTTKKRTAFTLTYGFDNSYQFGGYYKLF